MSDRPSPRELEPAPDERLAGKNPVHTGVFALLFVVMFLAVPVWVGGWIGLGLAPLVGAGLWGLYQVTLPSGPKQPKVSESAGSSACPSCGSVQTDRQRFEPDRPPWQCFACGHEW